jgi:hypothetical protein
MTLSSALLSNLAILTCWGISQAAIANPTPETLPPQTFQVSQWSEQSGRQPLAQPQWQQEEGKETVPQWSEPRKIDGINSPQWSEEGEGEPSPPARWLIGAEVDFLPHTLPSPAGPQPWRELLAEEVAPKISETPLAETSETEMPSSETSEEQPADTSPAKAPDSSETPLPEGAVTETVPVKSPLASSPGIQPTAQQLKEGEVTFNVYNRLYFIPNSLSRNGTGAYPDVGLTWGVTDTLELTLEGQVVDTGMPYRQGSFQSNTISDINSGRGEVVLEVKQRLWQNDGQNQALSGVLSLDWADGNYRFRSLATGQIVAQDNVQTLVPSLKVPFTAQLENWELTISPTVAFFPQSSALFLFRPPIEDPGSFGTTFGFTGAISYQVSPRLLLWGDAFLPLTGNNSINRDSGKPARTVGYNAGFRYLVNPRVALDVFASNTLGSKGALSLTADRDFVALGAGVTFMPDFIGANRTYPDSFQPQFAGASTPVKSYGLGLFDRETLNSGQFALDVKGGSNGIFGALSYGFLKDLEAGVYVDYTFGNVDESEQGFSGRVRLLNQKENSPLTVSLAATIGQTNQPFTNFINNNRHQFNRRGLDKTLPFVLNTDNLSQGEVKVFTVSLPLSYEFESGAALWLTPIWGYVQTLGTEVAGFNVGGLLPLGSEFSLLGEVGVNFAGEGNAFIGNVLQDATPWTAAIRWQPLSLLGINPTEPKAVPHFEIYVTNRVGFTPWLQMRVRDQNEAAVGGGFSIPF